MKERGNTRGFFGQFENIEEQQRVCYLWCCRKQGLGWPGLRLRIRVRCCFELKDVKAWALVLIFAEFTDVFQALSFGLQGFKGVAFMDLGKYWLQGRAKGLWVQEAPG